MQVLAIRSVVLRTYKVLDHLMITCVGKVLVLWSHRWLRPVGRPRLQTKEVVLLIEQMIHHHLKETWRKTTRLHHSPMLEQARLDPWLPALINPFSLRPRAERRIVGQMLVPASQRRIL